MVFRSSDRRSTGTARWRANDDLVIGWPGLEFMCVRIASRKLSPSMGGVCRLARPAATAKEEIKCCDPGILN